MSSFDAAPRFKALNSTHQNFTPRSLCPHGDSKSSALRGSSNVLYRSRRRRPSGSSSTVSSTPTFLSSRSRTSHGGVPPLLPVTALPRPESPPVDGCCGFLRRRRRSHGLAVAEPTVSMDAPSGISSRTEEWSPVGSATTAWHSLIDFPTSRHHAPSVTRSGSSSTSGSHLGLGRHADHQDFVLIDMRPQAPTLPPRQRHHSMGAAPPARPPRMPTQRKLLVRCLDKVFACPYYWGRMESRQAEIMLQSQASGTYLLRDSTHDRYIFTISYRWDSVIKHIRMEVRRGKYSLMDRMDFASPIDLIEYYRNAQQAAATAAAGLVQPHGHNSREEVGKLLKPLMRPGVFSLASLSRSIVCTKIVSYDALDELHLPPTLLDYLRQYSYDDIP